MTEARASKPVLEFKGRMMTLTILRVLNSSVEVLGRELDRRLKEAPALFRHLPVIVDVSEVASSDLYLDLPGFIALLRARDLVPVGIRGGDQRWADAADSAGLSVFAAERGQQTAPQPRSTEKAPARATAAATSAPHNAPQPSGGMLVTQPVRSGQQIYARGTDLVILAAVSPGAEVLADGHVHVYGSLGGRALAGVRGNTDARIFCKSFRAELVSIAGVYSVSEQFDEGLSEKPVQVSLHGDTLHIERL
jgi:septum site-determining protein MinC